METAMTITRDSLMTLEAYARARPAMRAEVMEQKKLRRIKLGENILLIFENELLIRYQIQEMLRVEKIFEEDGIAHELESYVPLLPTGSNFKVTMQIEYAEENQRREMLAKLKGVEDRVWVRVARLRSGVRDCRRRPRARERAEDLGRAFPALRAFRRHDRRGEIRRRALGGRRPPRIHRQHRRPGRKPSGPRWSPTCAELKSRRWRDGGPESCAASRR